LTLSANLDRLKRKKAGGRNHQPICRSAQERINDIT